MTELRAEITELLGGRIEVQSQLGEGSTFRFFVKTRAVAPKSAIAAMVDATSSATRPELSRDNSLQSAQSGAMTPALSVSSNQSMGSYADNDWSDHHILIVEDNIINQTVLKRQLVKAGLTCDVANNGLEALNLIRETDRQARRGGAGRKKRYNVVLMDLEMPGESSPEVERHLEQALTPVMDGLTAVKEIRAAEAAGTLARNMIVALTGNARQGQIDQAMAAGMDDGGCPFPHLMGPSSSRSRHQAVCAQEPLAEDTRHGREKGRDRGGAGAMSEPASVSCHTYMGDF